MFFRLLFEVQTVPKKFKLYTFHYLLAKFFYLVKYGSSNITSFIPSNDLFCFMSFQIFFKQTAISAYFILFFLSCREHIHIWQNRKTLRKGLWHCTSSSWRPSDLHFYYKKHPASLTKIFFDPENVYNVVHTYEEMVNNPKEFFL